MDTAGRRGSRVGEAERSARRGAPLASARPSWPRCGRRDRAAMDALCGASGGCWCVGPAIRHHGCPRPINAPRARKRGRPYQLTGSVPFVPHLHAVSPAQQPRDLSRSI